MQQKRMECFRQFLDDLVWIKHQFLSGIRDSTEAGSLWGMMRGVKGVRKSIHQSLLAKGLGLRLLCWGFKRVQQEIPWKEARTLQIGSVAFRPGQCTSPQSLSQTIWPRWASTQFPTLPIVETLCYVSLWPNKRQHVIYIIIYIYFLDGRLCEVGAIRRGIRIIRLWGLDSSVKVDGATTWQACVNSGIFLCLPFNSSALYFHQTPTRRYGHASTPPWSLPITGQRNMHSRRLWNGMFDRHRAEITVMQFTGHSLPVHPFVTAPWDFYLVPYCQPSSPTRSLPITGHRNMHFRRLWNGMFDCHRAGITVMQFTGHSLPVHHFVTASWDFYLVLYCQPSCILHLLSVTFAYSLSSPAAVMRQLRRWKRLWRRSLINSDKRTSMGPSRSFWKGTTSALKPEEITSKGTRVSCVYYQ